jgi:hypothetical protein
MKTLLEIFAKELETEPNILAMNTLKINQSVLVSIIKNGYFVGTTSGVITGFAKNGRVIVETMRGKKVVSQSNVTAK